MIVSPAPAGSTAKNPIGSTPWLLQVLAALGGALAAGALAGFLILRGRSVPRDEEFFAETLAPGE
jgi:ribose/xylose/arabinose/galactoside ABC-type transport system permease subunit